MYNAGCVWAEERLDMTGKSILTWAKLEPHTSEEKDKLKANCSTDCEIEGLR
jgi:hypothetical protein